MNYFTALLVAAGLPVTMGAAPAAITPVPSAPSIQTAARLPVATVNQVYQTIALVNQGASSGTVTVSQPAPQPAPQPTPQPTPPSAPPTVTPSAPSGSSSSSSSAPSTGSTGSGSGSAATSGSTTTASNSAMQMINLINQARQQAGLKPYTINPTLMQLAQERAVTLANGPFTSDMAGYGWPVQMEQAAGIQAQGMGAENIAEAGSVSQAFAMLMASPPHRSNILNPYETQIGVGVAPWGSGVAISELFIGPNS